MVFLMMKTWCLKPVEDAKNWIKTLIWKVCICWFALPNCITIHSTKNIKFFKNTFMFPHCIFFLPLHFQTNDSVISILTPCFVLTATVVCLHLSGFFFPYISNYSVKLRISFWFSYSVRSCFIFSLLLFPLHFYVCLQNCEKWLLALSRLSILLHGTTCSHWMDFPEILHVSIFQKSVITKIQVLLKSDNHNRYFTWRLMHVYVNTSLSYS